MHTTARRSFLPTLFACAAVLAGCAKKEPAPEPIRAVRTLTVAADSAGGSHEYAAEVGGRTEPRLGFRVGGKIVSRPAEVGQKVRAGQVLAQLDPADLKLAQEAANATLRSAQAAYELAAAEFKRYRDLRDQGFISALELERRETTLTAQRSQLDQAKANASVQGNQAGYAVLSATAAGVITAVEAEVGSVVAAGTPVVRLAHDGPRDAVFAVPEDGVAGLRALLGKTGAVQIKPWGSTSRLPATVREVAAAADPTTRTFLVKADVGTAAVQLGQTLTASIELPRKDAAAKLPLAAVMRQQGQTAVWLLDRSTMTVKLQPVQVAGADGNLVVVASGLSAGQTVITAGVHTLNPGQRVKLYDAPVPVGPTPAAPAASR
jgi:membrane fusion protein, multidrug efflux system